MTRLMYSCKQPVLSTGKISSINSPQDDHAWVRKGQGDDTYRSLSPISNHSTPTTFALLGSAGQVPFKKQPKFLIFIFSKQVSSMSFLRRLLRRVQGVHHVIRVFGRE